ncbi:hypothetical protein PPS11_25595 [Pseudomonas putida S11]|nr:hypothetical protein PPS11_25595 [Pseudomonas putida S11]
MYPAMSLISLLLYWQDKHQARTQAWRTPEKVLHASELLGGWPGALAGAAAVSTQDPQGVVPAGVLGDCAGAPGVLGGLAVSWRAVSALQLICDCAGLFAGLPAPTGFSLPSRPVEHL